MSDAEEFDRRQALIRSLTPPFRGVEPRGSAPSQPEIVWWRVKLRAGIGKKAVTAERDLAMRTEDALAVAQYVAREYPRAECLSIRRMKRSPWRSPK